MINSRFLFYFLNLWEEALPKRDVNLRLIHPGGNLEYCQREVQQILTKNFVQNFGTKMFLRPATCYLFSILKFLFVARYCCKNFHDRVSIQAKDLRKVHYQIPRWFI